MSAKGILFALLGVLGVAFVAIWAQTVGAARRQAAAEQRIAPTPLQVLIGAVTNFFDTLGVGSFATTTSIYRFGRMIDDRLLPGTLNVGHTLPTFAQAIIYITIVEVDMTTLILMIAASVVGAWLGARVVARLPRRSVQLGMGVALLGAAGLILIRLLKLVPPGGDALSLSGSPLVIGLAANVVIGALMTIGIGAYAPIMVVVSLLGMNQKAAFPIMMGSCAFLMPVASLAFIRRGAYDVRAALGLAAGGIPAVLLAAYIVKELPLDVVKWMVVAIVVYTAASMLRAAQRKPEGDVA